MKERKNEKRMKA